MCLAVVFHVRPQRQEASEVCVFELFLLFVLSDGRNLFAALRLRNRMSPSSRQGMAVFVCLRIYCA